MTINSINNTASSLAIGNIAISAVANTIASSNTNGNIILAPNGTGLVSIASAFTLPRVDGSSGFVLKTNGSGVVSWAAETAQPFAWTVVTANTQAITENNGYFANNSTQAVDFALPATAAVGDTFEVASMHANGFVIIQGAGQSITIGNQTTTTGIPGSITSSAVGDWVKIVCIVANTQFLGSVQQGNLTVA
jgi:hypothetical protein